ncbi:LON peptidase substrate-binding domain-containing protein [Streptomyces sp. TP-A0874]|uniref:LON peptidase substrate-binding domain-containing protein n=1 Tax=Streptomyces sp. TP-A0874 TaxID=549819 RepID=UPI0008538C67|nr:LON peptidase substrate-binding domain-containing protein [Streptomyces sp. TP-A0874]
MTTARLPLFPLNTVLLPGLVLPLNVFEQRYRTLMRDLLDMEEEESRRFVVVAIRDGAEAAPSAPGLPDPTGLPERGAAAGFGDDPIGAFYPIGCVADATTIRKKDPDDEESGFEVLATGTNRCRLLSVDSSGPYLTAELEEIAEVDGDGAGALASGVESAFLTYQKRLAGASEQTLAAGQELPEEPSVLSYLVAAAFVLDTPAKQRLLEAPDTSTRLARELKLLRSESALIRNLPSLPAVDLTRQPTSPN